MDKNPLPGEKLAWQTRPAGSRFRRIKRTHPLIQLLLLTLLVVACFALLYGLLLLPNLLGLN